MGGVTFLITRVVRTTNPRLLEALCEHLRRLSSHANCGEVTCYWRIGNKGREMPTSEKTGGTESVPPAKFQKRYLIMYNWPVFDKWPTCKR